MQFTVVYTYDLYLCLCMMYTGKPKALKKNVIQRKSIVFTCLAQKVDFRCSRTYPTIP